MHKLNHGVIITRECYVAQLVKTSTNDYIQMEVCKNIDDKIYFRKLYFRGSRPR